MKKLKSLILDKRIMAAAVVALGVTVAVSTFASGGSPGAPGVINTDGKPAQATGEVVVTNPQTFEQQIAKTTTIDGKPAAAVSIDGKPTKADSSELLVEVPNQVDADRLGSRLTPTKVPGSYELAVAPGTDINQAKAQAQSLPGVKAVSYDSVTLPNIGPVKPNDKLFRIGEQSNLDLMKVPQGWARSTGNVNVIVAVLDTGFNYYHPDLKNKNHVNTKEIPNNGIDDDRNGYIDDYIGFDFTNATQVGSVLQNDADGPMDSPFVGEYNYVSGHGSAVGSVIAGETNNGIGVAGINWKAKIMPLKVCNPLCDWTAISNAIIYAANNDAKVINMSLGGLPQGPPMVDKAIDYANSKGVIVVASSGNDGSNDLVAYPARHPRVISVGATNLDDYRKKYSNAGPGLSVVAPAGITTAYFKDGKYERDVEGTSFSAPEVAGLASLLASIHPDISPELAKAIIELSADKTPAMAGEDWTGIYGFGRINVNRALDWVDGDVQQTIKQQKDKVNKKKQQKLQAKQKKQKAQEKKQAAQKKAAEKKKAQQKKNQKKK